MAFWCARWSTSSAFAASSPTFTSTSRRKRTYSSCTRQSSTKLVKATKSSNSSTTNSTNNKTMRPVTWQQTSTVTTLRTRWLISSTNSNSRQIRPTTRTMGNRLLAILRALHSNSIKTLSIFQVAQHSSTCQPNSNSSKWWWWRVSATTALSLMRTCKTTAPWLTTISLKTKIATGSSNTDHESKGEGHKRPSCKCVWLCASINQQDSDMMEIELTNNW